MIWFLTACIKLEYIIESMNVYNMKGTVGYQWFSQLIL